MKKEKIKLWIASAFLLTAVFSSYPMKANAEDTAQILVTEYADLWTSEEITVSAGVPVKWYVHVPEGTVLKGCGATIKIPGLGWGTDTHNKEENHLTFAEGDNFVYEFTPEEAGDILFTCWMGSGCHKNYIHVTEKEIIEETTTSESETSVTETETIATESETSVTEPETIATESETSVTEAETTTSESETSETEAETIATEPETSVTEAETTTTETQDETDSVQIVITEYSELWTGNIKVKAGIPVKWYVSVSEDDVLLGCAKTIKIPGLGWGTDTHNKEENHLTLEKGQNFVYEFTPEETGDILFTCWMGSACHYNYIHVISDEVPESETKNESTSNTTTHSIATTTAHTTTVTTAASPDSKKLPSVNTTSSPKTRDKDIVAMVLTLIGAASSMYVLRKK